GILGDGGRFPLELSFGRMTGGRSPRYVGIVHDLRWRYEVEARLHETVAKLEEQYGEAELARSETRAILDATSEAMLLLSPQGRILAVNRRFEQLFKSFSGEILGRHYNELIPLFEHIFEGPEALLTLFSYACRTIKREYAELLSQRWPRRRELELYSTSVSDARGERLGRLYVFRDVTRERELDRMKSDFVSLVSHELRTPLTSIAGYVEMLVDGDAGPLSEEQEEYLGIVKRNTDRLTTLINDLLDVTRIEAGKIQLKREPLALSSIIRGVAQSLLPPMEAKEQTLTIDLPDDLPAVYGDGNRVVQIVTNLLSNAHKYTPRHGAIAISGGREGATVRVDIRDTGIGLSPDDQAKLFSRFFRADNPTTREVGGTGLGLWITRSLVEMHGGEITVTSTPGEGSTFSFTLPAVPESFELSSGQGETTVK
ncbi:MAG: PAS domain S-box protein, partial [Desulfuromonadales bacterium]